MNCVFGSKYAQLAPIKEESIDGFGHNELIYIYYFLTYSI